MKARRKNLPAFVVQAWGTMRGDRIYHLQSGETRAIHTQTTPWRWRSTIRESPLWGLRSGTAHTGVGGGAKRFVHRYRWEAAGMRRVMLLWDRRNHKRFYPGCSSRWD